MRKLIIRRGSSLETLIFITVSNPIKLRRDRPIPNIIRNIICGILVLDENKAAANSIARNIGMRYSKEIMSLTAEVEEFVTVEIKTIFGYLSVINFKYNYFSCGIL
jgi:hypothetical protein